MAESRPDFKAIDTVLDDISLIAFTSGDVWRSQEHHAFPPRHAGGLRWLCAQHPAGLSKEEIASSAQRRSPSLFGFGGVLFPIHIGASKVVLEKIAPRRHSQGDRALQDNRLLHRANRLPGDDWHARGPQYFLCFQNASQPEKPCRSRHSILWHEATGIKLMDGISSIELLHAHHQHDRG